MSFQLGSPTTGTINYFPAAGFHAFASRRTVHQLIEAKLQQIRSQADHSQGK